ncbi:MAG: T9SS type A sorting domain-containing protein, partial [Bacteroidia bacterium]
MYPDNSDPLGFGTGMQPQAPWSEVLSNNVPGDRRGLGASGPFTFEPSEMLCLDYVYLYARGTSGPASSVTRLQAVADSARIWYDMQQPCNCEAVIPNSIGENNAPARAIGLYPNPASTVLFINYEVTAANASWMITDVTGRIVTTGIMTAGNSSVIEIGTLAAGLYTLRITEGQTVSSARFVKQ